MKIKLMIFTFSLLAANCLAQEKCNVSDSLKEERIINYNYKKFIGKSIGDFVTDSTLNQYIEKRFYDPKTGVLKGIRFLYSKNLTVIPIIKKVRNINPVDKDRNWDYDKIFKETIYEFRIIFINDEFWISPEVSNKEMKNNKNEILKILRHKKTSTGQTRRFDTI